LKRQTRRETQRNSNTKRNAKKNLGENFNNLDGISTIADQEEDVRSDISGTLSIASVAESIFSLLSVSSKSSIGGRPEASERLVNLLINDEVIYQLCEQGLSTIETSRFGRNLRRLLKGLTSELKREAQTSTQVYATRFIGPRARNTAYTIRKKLVKDSSEISKTDDLEHEEEPAESDGIESDDGQDEPNYLEHFVTSSKALSTFCNSWRAFVDPRKVQHLSSPTRNEASKSREGEEDELKSEDDSFEGNPEAIPPYPEILSSNLMKEGFNRGILPNFQEHRDGGGSTSDGDYSDIPPIINTSFNTYQSSNADQGQPYPQKEDPPKPSGLAKLGLSWRASLGYISTRTVELTIWLQSPPRSSRLIYLKRAFSRS
jgi:hypothetical protein